jgi:O-antigen ligase
MMISEGLAFAIPMVLGVYWLIYSSNTSIAIALLRPCTMGASFLLALMWFRAPMTRVEKGLVSVLALLVAGLLVPSITATDTMRALQEWIKLILLSSVSLMLCRPLRNVRTASALGAGLILASAVLAAQITYVYIRHMGPVMPTYRTVRILKGMAEQEGIALNMVSFDCVFTCLCGMSLLRRNKLLWCHFAAVVAIATMLTGSRAQAGTLTVCVLVLLVVLALRSQRMIVRVAGAGLGAAASIGAAVFIAITPFKQMSAFTEGRWDLWWVAWQKFTERPLLGFGYVSWRDDLVSRLPGAYALTSGIAKWVAGGYHNQYMTALAEQGLLGFLVLMCFCGFLLKSSWRLAFPGKRTDRTGLLIFFMCLFLLLRANLEMSGLFAYAQEPGDYLAYIFVAIVVSRVSMQDDLARSFRLQREWYFRAVRSRQKNGVPANANASASNR